jgi:hypothetical protein
MSCKVQPGEWRRIDVLQSKLSALHVMTADGDSSLDTLALRISYDQWSNVRHKLFLRFHVTKKKDVMPV